MLCEIHQRINDGLIVTLYAEMEYDAVADKQTAKEISCRVQDTKGNQDFLIREIAHDKALEVFYHPFACGDALLTGGSLRV